MPTDKQTIGKLGEELVVRNCDCFKCKRPRTLRRLPPNFKCADIICDFCGYLAQVKATLTERTSSPPKGLRSAAWNVQLERMNAGIFFPLFVVLIGKKERAIFYLPADFQTREMFIPRNPLSATARKSGWQGYRYDFTKIRGDFIKVFQYPE
jgi:type II restriction enzyme